MATRLESLRSVSSFHFAPLIRAYLPMRGTSWGLLISALMPLKL